MRFLLISLGIGFTLTGVFALDYRIDRAEDRVDHIERGTAPPAAAEGSKWFNHKDGQTYHYDAKQGLWIGPMLTQEEYEESRGIEPQLATGSQLVADGWGLPWPKFGTVFYWNGHRWRAPGVSLMPIKIDGPDVYGDDLSAWHWQQYGELYATDYGPGHELWKEKP